MLYGRYPELGQLNFSPTYLSYAFDELNITVNYETNNYETNIFHVYSQINITYPPGFKKVQNNREIIDNPWHGMFIVGLQQLSQQEEAFPEPQGVTKDKSSQMTGQMKARKTVR